MTQADIAKKILLLGGMEPPSTAAQKKLWLHAAEEYLRANKLILPDDYLWFAVEFGSQYFIENIEFAAIEKLPVSENGGNRCPIAYFYGWGKESDSIQSIRKTYLGQMPERYFAIAEGCPGDQICICMDGAEKGKLFYWHHEALDGQEFYLIANSFHDFVDSLQKEQPTEEAKDDGFVSSWLSKDLIGKLKKRKNA